MNHHQTTNTFISSSLRKNNIQKILIDKNINLRLHLIQKRTKIIIDAKILYSNGLELKISPNYWKLISYYHKVQTDSIVYLYNFDSNTVNIRSYRGFFPNNRPSDQEVTIITELIRIDVTCFIEKLYKFGILNLKGKYFFKQNLQETFFHKKIITYFNSFPSNKDYVEQKQSQPQSIIADQKQLQLRSPNIIICPIQPIKGQFRSSDLPIDLQYGPKNIKNHFNNAPQLNKTKGGFFSLQKLYCTVQKKLQKNYQNTNSNNQNTKHNPFPEQSQNKKTYLDKTIIVKKSLKPERQQNKINRIKLLKELIMVQQIKNSKYLINYYLDQNQGLNFRSIFNPTNQKESKDLHQELEVLNMNQNKITDKKSKLIEISKVHMDFHPHTLHDYLSLQHNNFDTKMSMCLQMIESIIDIHKSKVIHRDLKPQNALIDFTTDKFNPSLKLIDFSESAIFISQTKKFQDPSIQKNIIREIFDKHSSRFYASTMPYSPPQCILNRQNRTSKGVNNFEIDYWSMGMVLFEIFTGKKLLNYSKPYEDDILNVIKEVGFENYFLKAKRRGFRIIENVIQIIAIKNIVYDQSKRMCPTTCQNILKKISQQFIQWTTSFNKLQQQKSAPQKSTYPALK